MRNLLEFKAIFDKIITCFFYDATSRGLKCFFMSQFVLLKKKSKCIIVLLISFCLTPKF
jgi:hypothetical protein